MASPPASSTRDPEPSPDANRVAMDALYPEVYEDLRRIAHQRLRQEYSTGTLNTTALVHEVYLRLSGQSKIKWSDRTHFFALASRAMRNILVDAARARAAGKRGGGTLRVSLDSVELAADDSAVELLGLDEALTQLAKDEARLGQLVEYRFFGGLTYEEIAEATGLSVPTVKRDWRRARSWLLYRMTSQ